MSNYYTNPFLQNANLPNTPMYSTFNPEPYTPNSINLDYISKENIKKMESFATDQQKNYYSYGYGSLSVNLKEIEKNKLNREDLSRPLLYKKPYIQDDKGQTKIAHAINILPPYMAFSIDELRMLNVMSERNEKMETNKYKNWFERVQKGKEEVYNNCQKPNYGCFDYNEIQAYDKWSKEKYYNDNTFAAMNSKIDAKIREMQGTNMVSSTLNNPFINNTNNNAFDSSNNNIFINNTNKNSFNISQNQNNPFNLQSNSNNNLFHIPPNTNNLFNANTPVNLNNNYNSFHPTHHNTNINPFLSQTNTNPFNQPPLTNNNSFNVNQQQNNCQSNNYNSNYNPFTQPNQLNTNTQQSMQTNQNNSFNNYPNTNTGWPSFVILPQNNTQSTVSYPSPFSVSIPNGFQYLTHSLTNPFIYYSNNNYAPYLNQSKQQQLKTSHLSSKKDFEKIIKKAYNSFSEPSDCSSQNQKETTKKSSYPKFYYRTNFNSELYSNYFSDIVIPPVFKKHSSIKPKQKSKPKTTIIHNTIRHIYNVINSKEHQSNISNSQINTSSIINTSIMIKNLKELPKNKEDLLKTKKSNRNSKQKESYLPKTKKYSTKPEYNYLINMSIEELSSIDSFLINDPFNGSIQFNEPIDITFVNIDNEIEIDHKSKTFSIKNKNLQNKKMTVSFYNIKIEDLNESSYQKEIIEHCMKVLNVSNNFIYSFLVFSIYL